jgi:hypothetical protein
MTEGKEKEELDTPDGASSTSSASASELPSQLHKERPFGIKHPTWIGNRQRIGQVLLRNFRSCNYPSRSLARNGQGPPLIGLYECA